MGSTAGIALILAAIWLAVPASSQAAIIQMNASDAGGTTSFDTGLHWVGGAAPTSGNDYVNSQYDLRTPDDTNNHTFAGDSLTLGDGTNSPRLIYKGLSGSSPTVTISNFIINKGTFQQGGAGSPTLAGAINVQSGGAILDIGDNARTFTIASNISGSGAITMINAGTGTGTMTFTGTNSYGGGTTIGGSGGIQLNVQKDGGLGTGDVSILSGGKLTLELGTLDDYIADSATLSLASGLALSSVNLNFSGTDTVGALSLDGGSTFLTSGLYTVSDLNTAYGSSVFTGAGQFNVVPEPATFTLLGMGLMALFLLRRRRLSA